MVSVRETTPAPPFVGFQRAEEFSHMPGEMLHEFDLDLCQHAMDNVRAHLGHSGFAAYADEQLDPAVRGYLEALDGDGEPAPLLLNAAELVDLETTFYVGPPEFDRPWIAYGALYRRSIDCAADIRDGLAPAYVGEWARLSAQFAERLECDRVKLSEGVEIVAQWVREVRRLLLAMGATHLLPAPEGAFPTPTNLEPPPLSSTAAAAKPNDQQSDNTLVAAVAETQALQREIRDLLVSQRTVKELYTTVEVAELIGRSEYTVREWCRKGQVQATKAPNGRSWLIAHAELTRLRNHGPTPEHQPDGVVDRRRD
jgi:excisionase family DNA binding protein